MNCPSCNDCQLAAIKTPYGTALACFNCAGHIGSLQRLFAQSGSVIFSITDAALKPERSISCPKCKTTMTKRRVYNDSLNLQLDVCYPCNLVWFDKTELEILFSMHEPSGSEISPTSIKSEAKDTHLGNKPNLSPKVEAVMELILRDKNLTPKEKAQIIESLSSQSVNPKRQATWTCLTDSMLMDLGDV